METNGVKAVMAPQLDQSTNGMKAVTAAHIEGLTNGMKAVAAHIEGLTNGMKAVTAHIEGLTNGMKAVTTTPTDDLLNGTVVSAATEPEHLTNGTKSVTVSRTEDQANGTRTVKATPPTEHLRNGTRVVVDTQINDQPNGTKPVTAAQTEDLSVLSQIISNSVQKYQNRLDATGLPPPDLQNPFPEMVKDKAAQDAKFEILRACEKLMAMVHGPVEWLMHQNMAFIDPACVGIALELNLFEHMALGEEATSLDELVERTGASRDIIERAMRVCTQRLCGEEVAPGQYRHNAVSSGLLVPPIAALVHYCCDDGLRTAGHFLETLRDNKFQTIDDPADSAFSRAFQTKLGMFDYYSNVDRKRGERFALGMAGSEMIKTLTEEIYPFETLPSDATVVDVGGGLGQVSLRIAEKIPGVKFIVQDQASVVEVATSSGMLEELEGRITFQAHNFFDEQPVKNADVYLFRFILHDHPDSACIRILTNIVRAMSASKSRILIDDAVIPDLLGSENIRLFNMLDIHMAMVLNAKERTRKQWEALCRETDERLVIERIWEEGGPSGGRVLELRLRE